MKLFAIVFPCCLIFSVSTSHFSRTSTFDYGSSSSLKTSLLNTTILVSDSHVQQAGMYRAMSAIPLVILFNESQRFKFAIHVIVCFRLKFCYMYDLGLGLRVIKKVRLEETTSQPSSKQRQLTKSYQYCFVNQCLPTVPESCQVSFTN